MSFLLYDDPPISISPKLATIFGLSKAVFLQQIHYWITNKSRNPDKYKSSFVNGYFWVYNTTKEWSAQMPFLGSEVTIKRIVSELKSEGVLVIESHNQMGFDKTNWYRINYLRLNQIIEQNSTSDPIDSIKMIQREYQIDTMDSIKMNRPIPETFSERSTETTNNNIDHSQANDQTHDHHPLFSISDFENKSAIEQDKMRQANLLHYLNASTSGKSDLPRTACGKVDKSSDAAKASEKAFDLFWEQYPRKTAKAAAFKAWAKLKASGVLIDTIMHDIANRKQNDHQWRDPAFVPHPATYLNGQRWTDEVVKAPALTNQKTGVQSSQSISEDEQMEYLRSYL